MLLTEQITRLFSHKNVRIREQPYYRIADKRINDTRLYTQMAKWITVNHRLCIRKLCNHTYIGETKRHLKTAGGLQEGLGDVTPRAYA